MIQGLETNNNKRHKVFTLKTMFIHHQIFIFLKSKTPVAFAVYYFHKLCRMNSSHIQGTLPCKGALTFIMIDLIFGFLWRHVMLLNWHLIYQYNVYLDRMPKDSVTFSDEMLRVV